MQVTDESLQQVGGVEAWFSGGALMGGGGPCSARPDRAWGCPGGLGAGVRRTAALTVGSLKAQPGRKGRPGRGSELMAAEALPPRAPATPSPRQPPARPAPGDACALSRAGCAPARAAAGRGCRGNGRAGARPVGPGQAAGRGRRREQPGRPRQAGRAGLGCPCPRGVEKERSRGCGKR